MSVLSDCWLNLENVLSALEHLLDGYELIAASLRLSLCTKFAFVLCGDDCTSESLG